MSKREAPPPPATQVARALRAGAFPVPIERGIGDERSLARAPDKASHLDRLVGDLFASRAPSTPARRTRANRWNAIARRLARAHGGEVEAANLPAGGARLTVTLSSS